MARHIEDNTALILDCTTDMRKDMDRARSAHLDFETPTYQETVNGIS